MRKALKFNMDTTRTPVSEQVEPTATAPAKAAAAAEQADRQQVGARVTKATYRRLKSRAALQGAKVQELVEQAIEDFLKKPEPSTEAD